MPERQNLQLSFMERMYHGSLGILSRCWLICCSRFPRFTLGLLVAAFVVLSMYVFQGRVSLYSSIPIVFFSVLAGMYLGAQDMKFFLGRFAFLMQSNTEERSNAENSTLHQTGLPLLDSFANLRSAEVNELRATIESMREEAEILVDRYVTLTENLAAAIIIRSPEGKILYCSPYTEVLTGYPIEDFYSENKDFFLSIVHENDHEAYSRALNANVIGEAYQARYRFYHQSGMEMWADTRTVPIYAEDGSLISSLSITLDVTGAVRQQKQVEEKNRDLEDFSYMISHDLKAPIYTIKGMVQVLKEDFGEAQNENFLEPVEHIEQASLRLEQLVASVLEYSRITTTKSEEGPVKLSEVFADIRNDFQSHLKSTQSTLNVPDQLPTVLGDRLKIYQIFANLVGNAIKYRSKERLLQIDISHAESRNDRHVVISVADNGSGIPKEKRKAVFRPFQRAHGKDIEGSGIGLACVRKLLEKLGGDIWLESEEQTGSTFYVQFRNNESYL